MEYLKNASDVTDEEIHLPQSKEKSVINEQAFTRNRKMTFVQLICFILNGIKTTTQTALNRYFALLEKDMHMSQSALSQARNKINHYMFKQLFERIAAIPYQSALIFRKCKGEKYKGRILSAIDGTQVKLPYTKKLKEHFGASGQGGKAVTGRCSIKYDMLGDVIMDACFDPFTVGERAQAVEMLSRRTVWDSAKELIIFDRGYYSREMVQILLKRQNTEFLMRIPTQRILAADALGFGCHIIKLEFADGTNADIRVIKLELSSGEVETLITNCYTKSWKTEDFKKLYFLRWPVETKYDIVKNKIALENLSGSTVNTIYQDVYVSLFMANIVATAKAESDRKISQERSSKNNKYQYQTNVNDIIGSFKDRFILAFVNDKDSGSHTLTDILNEIVRSVVPIRPDRSIIRPATTRKMKFYHNRKLNC